MSGIQKVELVNKDVSKFEITRDLFQLTLAHSEESKRNAKLIMQIYMQCASAVNRVDGIYPHTHLHGQERNR